jgi:hypothetical protein
MVPYAHNARVIGDAPGACLSRPPGPPKSDAGTPFNILLFASVGDTSGRVNPGETMLMMR